MEVGRAVFSMTGSLCYLAATGAGETRERAMAVRGGLAILFADGVVTRFRRQGYTAN